MRTRIEAAGFSLLEMLLVLVLVAAASVLAMAAFGGSLRGARLHAAANEVAAQLRFTRAVAIRSGTSQEFLLEPQARRWRAAHGRKGQLPETGTLTFTGARELQPASGVGAIRFFPDGAASGGRIRFAANGGGWDVDVGWLTGEVRVRRLQGGP